jgi:hypothetical protein
MKRELERIEIPGEHDSRERAWRVVSSAFGEREPVPPRPARRLVPVLVAVFAAAIVAAALSPPGRAVFHAIRETVGVEKAQPALFSLPAPGRLLVTSGGGVWIVQADGSKRRLGSYASASWSPHGRYVVTTRRNALYALTPEGAERWSLARPDVRFPRWTGTETDTRIAYLTTSRLHVVGGDGKGDVDTGGTVRGLSAAAPAWRPGPKRVLAFANTKGRVAVVHVDTRSDFWQPPAHSAPFAGPRKLEWSSDGGRLLLVTKDKLVLFGTRSATPISVRSARVVDAAFRPGTRNIAVIRRPGEVSQVVLGEQVLFSTVGDLRGLTWSPDGRWLLVGLPEADQWVFVRADGKKIVAVSNVSEQFRSRSFPRIEGWTR